MSSCCQGSEIHRFASLTRFLQHLSHCDDLPMARLYVHPDDGGPHQCCREPLGCREAILTKLAQSTPTLRRLQFFAFDFLYLLMKRNARQPGVQKQRSTGGSCGAKDDKHPKT